jgi:hypothetical protein
MFSTRTQVDGNVTAFQVITGGRFLTLGADGNLWLEVPPFGNVPPSRTEIDGNVRRFSGAGDGTTVWVLGRDGKLWVEEPPFGSVPPKRTQIDANVKAFEVLPGAPGAPADSNQLLVLGTDGKLWREVPPFGTVPPANRTAIDGNVTGFASFGSGFLVLGSDGILWAEEPPFGSIPPKRTKIDANVSAFQATTTLSQVWVLGTDGNLWFETAPFGTVPPNRTQIDGNVMLPSPDGQPGVPFTFAPLGDGLSGDILVLGSNGALWLEQPPFGQGVPPRNRLLIDQNVLAFSTFTSNQFTVLGNNNNLWIETVIPSPPGNPGGGTTALPQHLDFSWTPIVFGGGVPVGGWSNLTVRQDGTYTFSGHFHDSGATEYNMALVWAVKDSQNKVYTFKHTGHVSGTFEPGSRDDDWSIDGQNDTLAQNWANIAAANFGSASANASGDLTTLMNEILGAVGVVLGVISIV